MSESSVQPQTAAPMSSGRAPADTRRTGVVDPVCGMSVTEDAAYQYPYGDKTYYFCSSKCFDAFRAAPTKYLHPVVTKTSSAATGPGTVYTCPMHPQIRASAPGNCPICGMALEPVTPLALETRMFELKPMTRRF